MQNELTNRPIELPPTVHFPGLLKPLPLPFLTAEELTVKRIENPVEGVDFLLGPWPWKAPLCGAILGDDFACLQATEGANL